MLARILEKAGFATILVTPMPYWAEKTGVPRTLGVEFPFAQPLGQPHDTAQQMRVIRQALSVLERAESPGTIIHSPEPWPVPQLKAVQDWQPLGPSPIIQVMAPRMRDLLRKRRKTNG